MAVARPLPNLDVYRSLHAGFHHFASPSALIAAAAAAAAAAALKSSTPSTFDHHEPCPQVPPPRPPERTPSVVESPPVSKDTALAAAVTVTGSAGLVPPPSLNLPAVLSPENQHPLLPTLGFTLEQVLSQHLASWPRWAGKNNCLSPSPFKKLGRGCRKFVGKSSCKRIFVQKCKIRSKKPISKKNIKSEVKIFSTLSENLLLFARFLFEICGVCRKNATSCTTPLCSGKCTMPY